MIAFEYLSAQIATEACLAAITPEGADLDTAAATTIPVLGRLCILNPAERIAAAARAIEELLDGSTVAAAERFNIPRAEAQAMRRAVCQGADWLEQLDRYLNQVGVTAELWSRT